jgi:prolipoprotein diacylglyceryltransferase
MLISFINWNPSPNVFGTPVRWYGLLFGAAFYFAWILFKRFFTRERVPLFHLEKLAIWMAIACIGGARLGHVLFYQPEYYFSKPWEILFIWQGGLASHGAAICLVLATIIYARKYKWSLLWLGDRVAIPVALAALLIRGGNFINQEIMGNETTASYGVVFQGADQAYPNMYAGWEGEKVKLYLRADESMGVMGPVLVQQSTDTMNWRDVGVTQWAAESAAKPTVLVDDQPVKQRSHYRAMVAPNPTPVEILGQDSADVRRGSVRHSWTTQQARVDAHWKGDSVVIELTHLAGLAKTQLSVYASTDGVHWSPVMAAVLHDAPTHEFRFAHLPGNTQPRYWITTGRHEMMEMDLFARHPAQLYEGALYFLIFLFLLWQYYRRKGKIPHGLFFGQFMTLIFGVRIVVESLKEEQTEFPLPVKMTMGALLSIPFVILGLVLWFRALRKGANDASPSVENWEELEAARNAKGKKKPSSNDRKTKP